MPGMVHLHNHSEFSALDGLDKPEVLVKTAVLNGDKAIGLTDHGVMGGIPEFYWACKKEGIEPVIGCEFYFAPSFENAVARHRTSNFHIVILAKNLAGVETLMELCSAGHRQFYQKPLIDRATISAIDTSSLICLSGCAGSIISKKAIGEERGDVDKEIAWWKRKFPHFYIELQDHSNESDRILNEALVALAQKHSIPWVVTNDPHYALAEDACHHDALLAIQTGSDIDSPDRFRFEGEGFHLRTRNEMRRAFQKYGDQIWRPGVANTLRIAQMCKTTIPAWESRTWHIPRALEVEDATETLRRAAVAGLRARGLRGKAEYVSRMRDELERFRQVPGMADFLLINAEANAYARSQGIAVGPGRGSVCGTLVGYLIGIHKIDPVRYGLLFERFLNPDRPKMPDIDTDFEPDRRHEMFDWARQRFGNRNVMLVSAYGTMKLKRAFQSIARAHGIEFQERLRISKQIIEDEEGNAIIPPDVAEAYPGLVEQLNRLEGTKASISRHPAGLLIFDADDPIRKLIPEQWIASSKQMVSGFDLDTVNSIGLMKQDFLGVRNLAAVGECVRLVNERHGIELDPDSWVPDEEKDDKVIYKMLRAGKVTGVFQLEGASNAKGIRQIKPTCFEDIVSCTSLYRKGPIMAGAPDRFLRNKQDQAVRVAHPSLEPYLNLTWGEMIYQEQMFEILYNLAGFSWARVDDAKTAMTKKDAEKMKEVLKEAMTGFRRNGMDQESAKEVVDMIQSQAEYLFNRCATGDTLIYRSNFTNSSGQTISLADLYRIWHGARNRDLAPNETSLRSAYRRRGLTIKAYKDGAIRRAKVKDVHCNGVKDVWEIILANGMSIKTTGNHRHLGSNGWVRTDNLVAGDSLVVDSGKYARPSLNNAHVRNGLGMGWAGRPDTGRAIASDGRNRPTRGGHVAGLNAVTTLLPDLCEKCGETAGRLERAHLNGDRADNSRENVLLLCNHCHKQHDWDTGQRVVQYAHGYIAETSEVVSVLYAGSEMTYDLEMDDPGHNFVANGIVTHNSHAVGYSMLSYQTARLKYLYPLEFMAALLRTVDTGSADGKDKQMAFLAECTAYGFKLLPPDINKSAARFTPEGDMALRWGLRDVKGVGEKAVQKILDGREQRGGKFRRATQVQIAANNEGVMKALEKAGAFGCFGIEAVPEEQEEVCGWQFYDPIAQFREEWEPRLVRPKGSGSKTMIVGDLLKVEQRTTKKGDPFMLWTVRWTPAETWKVMVWASAHQHHHLNPGSVVICAGNWNDQFGNLSIGDPDNICVLLSK